MYFTHFVPLLLTASAAVTYAAPLSKRAADFIDPHAGHGSMGAQTGGVREPLNVCLPSVLESPPSVSCYIGSCLYTSSYLAFHR